MLMRNFNRVYRGEEDELGVFRDGTRAPWGLYMHAAWFFGQPWHYDGYKMFVAEITNNTAYPDVYIVPIEAGLRYGQTQDLSFNSPSILKDGWMPQWTVSS